MDECIFCNTELIKDDILWESKNFFAKVGVGILAPGHIMLVTKKHISCFGDLPDDLDEEFLAEKEKTFEAVKSNFSEPLVLEHGVYNQSVKHAHIHFIPKKNEFFSLENITEKVFAELLRVGKKVIVSFPNFAHWRCRAMLYFCGKAPVTKQLPFGWHNSPNIHFLSLKDFDEFCRKLG